MDGGEKKEVRRPMNAFLIFCKRHRSFVREKNPDMDNRSVTRVLGDLWANLGEEKKIYTNLAKQYKDAFMKANPNYKWHSADKSQSSSAKVISKPTNSRVIKNVAEIHTDGSIIPGKLADPDKMGGLNLLLMADKETFDSRSVTSSVTLLSMTRASTTSSPTSVQATIVSSIEQSSVSNSALLQLAEMCASELRGSSDSKPMPHHLTPLTLAIPPSSLPLLDSTSHHAMPPPKKRARHWSLTETDNMFETTNDNGSKEYIFGSMSLQNASLQKLRCTSVGSAVCPDDKFSSLEKYKSPPSRRKLSSSATESIPSPSVPSEDETDSPVFSPDNPFHGDCDQMHRNFSQSSESVDKNPLPVSNPPFHPPLGLEEQQPYQKCKNQTQVALSLQLRRSLSPSAAGLSRSGLWLERKEPQDLDQTQHTPYHGILLPLHKVLSLGTDEGREAARSVKDNSSDFHTWREPGKSKAKGFGVSPGSLNLKVITSSATESCPLPSEQLNQHNGSVLEYKNPQHSLNRIETLGDIKTSSTTVSGELRSVSNSSSIIPENTLFSSALSDRKMTSNLKCLDTRTAKLPLKLCHNTSETLSVVNNGQCLSDFSNNAHEVNAGYKMTHQSLPVQKMMLSNVTRNNMFDLKVCNPKTVELGNLASTTPPTSQPQTFSEGKLKKKWAERMLIESRLNEDLVNQQAEKIVDDLSRNDQFNIVKSPKLETDSNQNISQNESTLESSKLRNLIGVTTSCSLYSESEDFKISTGSHSTVNLLNKSHCSLEATQNQPSSPQKFSTGSHTKIILHPSQDQQNLKQTQVAPQTCSDKIKIKSESSPCGLTIGEQDQKLFHYVHNDSNVRYRKKDSAGESEDVLNKQALNQITACGKRFMDHVVEQLCKTDFCDKKHFGANESMNCVTGGLSKKNSFTEVKLESGTDFDMGYKEESSVKRIKKEEERDINLTQTASSVKKVLGSSPQTEGFTSCRKTNEEASSVNHPSLSPASLSNHTLTGSAEESSRKWETCRRAATSPSSDACFQNQWSAMPESCDQSDFNEDTGIQPLRKSRRPNRGQKYQELIKEGFIQPSRERMAARNADRHGKSFGTREEFEKVEMKRTLKRSASERDTPSESMAVSFTNATVPLSDTSTEKRFTSGDFDLEKEIESLPVCSLEQLDKKKVMRRRCDSDTLGSPACHRSNSDASINLTTRVPSSSLQAKLSPHTSLTSKFEAAVDLCDSECPAPHIPLPKDERPTEPVTGSRKRKARKHCITRISVLDKKASPAETAIGQKCVQSIPSTLSQKKCYSLPGDIHHSTVSKGDKNIPDLAKNMSHVDVISDGDGSLSEIKNFKDGCVLDKMAGNVASVGNAVHSVATSNLSAMSSTKNGLISTTSSAQLLSVLSTVRPVKAVSLTSDKYCGSHLASTTITTHKKNKGSLLSSVPVATHTMDPNINPKTMTSGTVLLQSSPASKVPSTTTDHPSIRMENACSLISTEESYQHIVTLSSLKTKILPVLDLSNKEIPTKKCLDRKPKKISGGIPESSEQRLRSPISKSQFALKKKYIEKKVSPVLSRSSNTPLVSALLGHSDLSSVIKLAEQGDGSVTVLKTMSASDKANLKSNAGNPHSARDFPPSVLSSFKTQLTPLSHEQSCVKVDGKYSVSQKVTSKSSSNSTHRAAILISTTEAFPSPLEPSSLCDRLPFTPSSKSITYKPHKSTLLSAAVSTSSFINETVSIRLQQGSMTVSQLPLQRASLVACSSNNPDPRNSRVSTPHTSAILTYSLLNQVPSAAISSTSSPSGICPSSSRFVSSTSPLLSLIPPHSSSSAVLPPTVISLAASTPSSKSDIVSYTVIGSSSVMDAGSPHMIGSPHLPESPSVAIVKS